MLLKTFQLTSRNFRNVARLLAVESGVIVPAQNYARLVSRKGKIVNEDELFDVSIDSPNPTPPTVKPKRKFTKSKAKDTRECNESMSKQLHTKLYQNDKVVSSIMMSLLSKKQRKKSDQIVLEGKRLIQEALEAKIKLETLLFSRHEDVKDWAIPKTAKMYKVPYRTIQLWSTLTTSPGVMGVFQKPGPLKLAKNSLPITVVCDNVRDPGNMGSILRAAAGVGVEKVILTKGCVDFWDPKVLRSAAGAHFQITVYSSIDWVDIESFFNDNAQAYVADNNTSVFEEDVETCVNEEETNKADQIEEDDEEEEDAKVSETNKKSKKNYYQQKYKLDVLGKLNNIPLVPYYSVDYTSNQAILIVGGETEGVSHHSIKLLQSRQGLRVNIPLENNVNSLNSAMALGIIAFEMKRQYLGVQSKLKQKQVQ